MLVKGIPTHFTLDNNYGTEETATGHGTTHDTNMVLFQPILKNAKQLPSPPTQVSISEVQLSSRQEIPEFEIGNRKGPPLFAKHKDNESRDRLDWCLKRYVDWALSVALSNKEENVKLMGSWTCFNKEVKKDFKKISSTISTCDLISPRVSSLQEIS